MDFVLFFKIKQFFSEKGVNQGLIKYGIFHLKNPKEIRLFFSEIFLRGEGCYLKNIVLEKIASKFLQHINSATKTL